MIIVDFINNHLAAVLIKTGYRIFGYLQITLILQLEF
jgi:hypothetical protein